MGDRNLEPHSKRRRVTCKLCSFTLQQKGLNRHYVRKHDEILIEAGVDLKNSRSITAFLLAQTPVENDEALLNDEECGGHQIVQAPHGRPGSKRGTGLLKKAFFVPSVDYVFLDIHGADASKMQNLIGYVRWSLHKKATTFLQILKFLSDVGRVGQLHDYLQVEDDKENKFRMHGKRKSSCYMCV